MVSCNSATRSAFRISVSLFLFPHPHRRYLLITLIIRAPPARLLEFAAIEAFITLSTDEASWAEAARAKNEEIRLVNLQVQNVEKRAHFVREFPHARNLVRRPI